MTVTFGVLTFKWIMEGVASAAFIQVMNYQYKS